MDIVYFDLETQRSFGDVGGAANKDKMGISVGVAYSTRTEQYHIFNERSQNFYAGVVDKMLRV